MKKIETHYSKLLKACKDSLSLEFKNDSILLSALTHKTYCNENKNLDEDNQRLEFLGDSVLSLVIVEYIYKKFPNAKEGVLSKMKSVLVSEVTLSEIAKEINLGSFILLGNGEDNECSRDRASLLADLLESIIGAIYIDSGFNCVSNFILRIFNNRLEEIDKSFMFRDYKSIFQEKVQNKYKCPPKYVTTSITDKNKSDISFISVLYVNDKEIARAYGKNKKEAEMNAASIAMSKF